MIPKVNYNTSMANLWKHTSNDRYYAVWQENNKTRRVALCEKGSKRATKDKAHAKKLLNHFNRKLLSGKASNISRGVKVNLFEFVTEFLSYIEASKEDSTHYLYDVALRKAKDSWGDIKLNHITNRHFDQVIMDMIRADLKPPTINKNLRHIKAAIRKAVEWEYINKAPIFPKPLKVKTVVRYIPKNHLRKIIKQITNEEFYDFCMLSGYTGLRSGELIRLNFDDIDNPKGFLRITPEQKNKDDSRIPINSTAREILNRCVARKLKKVFRFKSQTDISHAFKRVVRKAEFETYQFHDLRHTFASMMAINDENPVAIQELMRHKSFTSTLVYTKLSPSHLKAASEKLNLGSIPRPTKKSPKK